MIKFTKPLLLFYYLHIFGDFEVLKYLLWAFKSKKYDLIVLLKKKKLFNIVD